MTEFVDWLKRQAKFNKALVEALPDIEALDSLKTQIKEHQALLDSLQININDRTAVFNDLGTQIALTQKKLASEALKAKEEASRILTDAGVKAADLLNSAEDEAKEIVEAAIQTAEGWDVKAEDTQSKIKVLNVQVSELEQKYNQLIKKIQDLKNSI